MGLSNRHFYRFGPFRLSETEGVLRRDGQVVPLGPKAVETLLVLLRNRQRVVSREELMKAVWPDSVVEENNLDQQIAALRRTLSQGQNSQVYIETIPRRGYRFVPEVTEAWEKLGQPRSSVPVHRWCTLAHRSADVGRWTRHPARRQDCGRCHGSAPSDSRQQDTLPEGPG